MTDIKTSARNEKDIKATQFTLGYGEVDVMQLSYNGRRGLYIKNRENPLLPIGSDGELVGRHHDPSKGEVVIWFDNLEGGAVLVKIAQGIVDGLENGHGD